MKEIEWGNERLRLKFDDSEGFSLTQITVDGDAHTLHRLPMLNIATPSAGHVFASSRLAHTTIGATMKVKTHREYIETHEEGTESILDIVLESASHGLTANLTIRAPKGLTAIAVNCVLRNTSQRVTTVTQASIWATSWPTADRAPLRLTEGRSDWLGEFRWKTSPWREAFPDLSEVLTGHDPRGSIHRNSRGSWSTGEALPSAILSDPKLAMLWEVVGSAGWEWEVGDDTAAAYVVAGGPTELSSGWSRRLQPQEQLQAAEVDVAFAPTREEVLAQIVDLKRALVARSGLTPTDYPVVFNDYLNSLNGDPTSARLRPLIKTAAEVGSDIFLIDAGWYADDSDWWDGVGEWKASTTRFDCGLEELTSMIRRSGMKPGLWMEPEVVGVSSPIAELLPERCFFHRHGVRVLEHGRFHLDFSVPETRAHIDAIVDHLIEAYELEYLKLDYNINSGYGTDVFAESAAEGLRRHNAAYLQWVRELRQRHPGIILENCASGGMRADAEILRVFDLQSITDQQDERHLPPIVAGSLLSVLPAQAGNWAYPDRHMSPEQAAYCLAMPMLGRYILSGRADLLSPDQLALVREALAAYRSLNPIRSTGSPVLPLGFQAWSDPIIAAGLRAHRETVLVVWSRGSEAADIVLPLHHLAGQEIALHTLFPSQLDVWPARWDSASANLHIRCGAGPAARVFLIQHPQQPR